MKEYRCIWWQCPTSQHHSRVDFVEAADEETAKAVLKDHIERVHGIAWFMITEIKEYTRPTGGRVISQ